MSWAFSPLLAGGADLLSTPVEAPASLTVVEAIELEQREEKSHAIEVRLPDLIPADVHRVLAFEGAPLGPPRIIEVMPDLLPPEKHRVSAFELPQFYLGSRVYRGSRDLLPPLVTSVEAFDFPHPHGARFYLRLVAGNTKQTGVARFSIDPGLEPSSRTEHRIILRAKITNALMTGTVRVQLYQGAIPISPELESPPLTNSFDEYILNIADADAATITDYTDLELRMYGYSSTGDAVTFNVSQLCLRIPPGFTYVTTSYELPWSSMQQLDAVFTGPWDAVEGITATKIIPYESLLGLTSTFLEPYETLHSLSVAILNPYESLVGISSTRTTPYESLTKLSATKLSPWESLQRIRFTGQEPYESLSRIAYQANSVYESLYGVRTLLASPFESLLGIRSTSSIAYESIGFISRTNLLPYESLRRITTAVDIFYDSLLGISLDSSLSWESGRSLTTAYALPWEARGQVTGNFTLSWEALQTLTQTGELPLETLVGLALTGALPWSSISPLLPEHLLQAIMFSHYYARMMRHFEGNLTTHLATEPKRHMKTDFFKPGSAKPRRLR